MFADNVSSTLTQSDMFTALRKVLLKLVDVEVLQSQQNRVSSPTGNFITMTSLGLDPKSTNRTEYENQSSTPGNEVMRRTLLWRVQLDCYGNEAATMCNLISTVFRSEWACEAFNSTGYAVSPISAGEPRQTAFIDSEQQYGDRWSVDLTMQADVYVRVGQYFFDSATITAVSVDTLS